MKIQAAASLALLATALAAAPVRAVAVDSDPSPPVGGDRAAGKQPVAARDWNGAIRSLEAAARRDSRNADIQNLLDYAYRNAGQLDAAFKHYEHALQLDPRHRDAHECVGEAYLMVNNLAKAEEHIAVLNSTCPWVCEERDDLAKSIERYRSGKK